MPRGVLLVGPPGTGKTLLAKAVAGESHVPFFSLSGSEFVEMFVGLGAARVRDLFEQAKKKAPCIIFIDELDALGKARGIGMTGGHDEREQTLNQLLVEMDGFDPTIGVILMAATNRPDILDEAITRPGRFDRIITIPLPDQFSRHEIFKIHTRGMNIEDTVDYDRLLSATQGRTGADIKTICTEAGMFAIRDKRTCVRQDDFRKAIEKVQARGFGDRAPGNIYC